MVEENDWSTVEVSQGEVEYEIEEPEVNQKAEEDIKEIKCMPYSLNCSFFVPVGSGAGPIIFLLAS